MPPPRLCRRHSSRILCRSASKAFSESYDRALASVCQDVDARATRRRLRPALLDGDHLQTSKCSPCVSEAMKQAARGPPGETADGRSTPNCPTHTSDAPQPSAEPMPGAHAPANTSCPSQSQEAAPERETCCEMYGCSKDMLVPTACCRRRLCPECTLRCSQRRLDPAELRDFCARFTQSGADVSATAAVADFKCPFCRSVEPLSEREVCMQSMMIAIGPLFRANE